MKKIYILLFSCVLSLGVSAQEIVFAEYFWDTDPGFGMGIGTAIGPNASIDTDLTIDPQGLAVGLHWLYVRTLTNEGVWSIPSRQKIFVHEIVEAEYFWDEDPGLGNGQSISISAAATDLNESVEIQTAGLAAGRHNLGVRLKSKGGRWLPINWTSILVTTEFNYGEYFWDTDPGIGNGVYFDVPNDQTNSDVTISVSNEGLISGWHTLYTRMKGVNSSFGPNYKQRVYIEREVVSGEYFWDTDPGVGNGIELGTLSLGATAQVCDEVSTVGISEGIHYLYVRTVSEDNIWSIPTRIQITVTPNEILVGCPGDFDRNGFVAAGDLLAFLGGFGSSGDCTVDLNGDFVVDTSDLLIFLGLFGSVCE